MDVSFSFEDKVVWVTGASSGIGRAIARAFARAGARVAWNSWGDPAYAREQMEWFEKNEFETLYEEFDITAVERVRDFVHKIHKKWGGIHILVNNAGIRKDAVSWKMELANWARVIDVNLTGAFICTQAVIPIMRHMLWGRIVFIASINALRGKFGQTNYSASKAGLIGLAKSLARECARFNITVNVIAPGMVLTPMTLSLPEHILEQARNEALLHFLPEPEDIASTVLFISSDSARCITGEVIRVDSGQYLSS